MFFQKAKSVEDKVRNWRYSTLTSLLEGKARHQDPYEMTVNKIINLLAQEKIVVAQASTILWMAACRIDDLKNDAAISILISKGKEEGGENMREPYRVAPYSPCAENLAEKILDVLVSAGTTYREADDALSCAQKLLAERTVPVIAPQQDD